MNYPKPSADDPQFTAFALGELSGDERVAVEVALRGNPALRAEVEQIRAAAAAIEAALAREPSTETETAGDAASRWRTAPPPPVRPEQASASSRTAQPTGADVENYPSGGPRRARGFRAAFFRFPRFYFVGGGLAVAGLAVFVWLRHEEYATRVQAEATLTRIARARGAPELPIAAPTAWVAFSLPPAAGEAGGGATLSPRYRGPAGAIFQWGNGSAENAAAARSREGNFARAAERPRSTFPIAVDTTAYADLRRSIHQGVRPPPATVRVEGLVNHFPFRYPAPKNDAVFAAALEVAAAPWFPTHRLVRIGLKGREPERAANEPAGAPGVTIAKDVRVQVEFNPARVGRYRLVGFEPSPARTSESATAQGDDDDVQAGHVMTAFYEVVPVGVEDESPDFESTGDPLKYRLAVGAAARPGATETNRADASGELLTVTVWYRLPDESGGRWLEFPLADNGATFAAASPDFRFAAAVAQYGMVLRGTASPGAGRLGDILAWAAAALQDAGEDVGYQRSDFLDLVRRTQGLTE
jgi:hypothetical protein